MADQHDDDRTEQASGRRLERAREEGEVALSRDVGAAAGVAGVALALIVAGPALRDSLVRLLRATAETLKDGRPGELLPLLARPASIAGVVCAGGMLAVCLATAFQTRGGFWPHLALPKGERLFGGGRLRRLFKREVFVDLGLTLVKIVTLAIVLHRVLRDDFLTLPRLVGADADRQLTAVFAPLASGLVTILTALALLAGVDFALTRFRFRRRMKMTKDELRREMKEDEGDPLLRSRRRRRHRDLLKGRAAVEVPRADVLVVNPTHVAIALRYRPGEDKAPRVTAKGKGVLAELMRELAHKHGIAIVEDVALARLLYRRVKVGRAVPVETYRAVAAVLAFVYRVLGRRQGASAPGEGGPP